MTNEKIKLASRFCPNYFFLSANLTRIKSFIVTHQDYHLARRNARYALLIEDNNDPLQAFNSTSFLDDIKFYKKVLNLAVLVFSKSKIQSEITIQTGLPIRAHSSFEMAR